MIGTWLPWLARSAYVLTVSAVAAVGFTTDSTAAILLAGLLALPASLPAIVGYYVVYGLLAQVPGANPDSSSGSMSCSPDGACHGSTTGDAATWFVLATETAGILALTVAAVLNVAVVHWLLGRGRRSPTYASTKVQQD